MQAGKARQLDIEHVGPGRQRRETQLPLLVRRLGHRTANQGWRTDADEGTRQHAALWVLDSADKGTRQTLPEDHPWKHETGSSNQQQGRSHNAQS